MKIIIYITQGLPQKEGFRGVVLSGEVWVRDGNGRMRDSMGGMVEGGGWVGSLETRNKSGGSAEVALFGAEIDRI